MLMKAVCVDPARIHEFLPLVSKMIRAAMEHTDLGDYQVIERNLHDGSMFLWLAWDDRNILGAFVTELSTANGKKFCNIIACGGRQLEKWCCLINDVEAFAKAEGCISVRICGRRGWQRQLDGYEPIATILEKELI